MRNRLKLFNFGLYKEGLRLTKNISVTFIFILNMIAILLPLGIASIIMENRGESIEKVVVSNFQFIYLYFVFLIVAPILVIMLFHFLSKRRACDVFDVLPHRRETIFISFMSAIITWLLVIITETFVVGSLTFKILGKYFTYGFDEFFGAARYCVSIFICSLLVAVAFALAYACNGTVITTIATAYSILITPRLIISAPIVFVWLSSEMLAKKPMISFFDHNTNLLFASVFSPNDAFLSIGSIAYTLVLIIVLFLLGVIAYKKRNSDTAGRCGASRAVVTFTQVGLTTVIVLPIFLYLSLFLGNFNDFAEIIMLLAFYIGFSLLQSEAFSLGLMIGYEAIASRGLKKFKKFLLFTLPSFIIMQLIMFLIVIGSYLIETNIVLPAKLISNVTLLDGSFYVAEELLPEYEDKVISDKEIIEEISDILENNVEDYQYDDDYSWAYEHDITVAIKAGPITIYRTLYMTESDYTGLLLAFNKY